MMYSQSQGEAEELVQRHEGQTKEISPYISVLLERKETIHWNVSNFAQLIDTNCWPAMCFTFECRGSLGRNYTWRLSLFGDEDYLYGRAELLVPVKYRVPYSVKFSVLNKPNNAGFSEEEDCCIREIANQSEPQKWKILDKKYLSLLKNPEDVLKLKVEITTYGSETSKEFHVQNYPY